MAITKIQSNAFPASIDLSNIDLTLGANEVLTANIADSNITTAKIADGAVHTDKIADNNVTHAKLHTDMDLSGKTVTLPALSSPISVTAGAPSDFAAGVVFGSTNSYLYESASDTVSIRVGGDGPYIQLGDNDGKIGNKSGSTRIIAGTGTAEITLGTNGNVGIGTSSPGEKLHVEGSIRASGNVGVTQPDGDYLARLYQSSADGFLELYTGESDPVSRVKIAAYGNSYINPNGGGNVGIGTTAPSEELHIYDAVNDPYVLVDGSGANRDSGYKINAGNGVKIIARANAVGHTYFNDDSISIIGQIGNGGYRSHIFDSEIQVGGRYSSSNPARVVVARVIEPKDLSLPSGWVVQGGQIDTVSGTAYKRPSTAPNSTAFFGPYGLFPPGSYTALFRMKVTNNSSTSGWGYIDVSGGAVRDPVGHNPRPRIQGGLSPSSFGASNVYQYFALDFECINSGEQIEFRWISWVGGLTDLWLDHILVVPRLNHN